MAKAFVRRRTSHAAQSRHGWRRRQRRAGARFRRRGTRPGRRRQRHRRRGGRPRPDGRSPHAAAGPGPPLARNRENHTSEHHRVRLLRELPGHRTDWLDHAGLVEYLARSRADRGRGLSSDRLVARPAERHASVVVRTLARQPSWSTRKPARHRRRRVLPPVSIPHAGPPKESGAPDAESRCSPSYSSCCSTLLWEPHTGRHRRSRRRQAIRPRRRGARSGTSTFGSHRPGKQSTANVPVEFARWN